MNRDPMPYVIAAAKEIILSIKDGDDEPGDLPTVVGTLERFERELQESLRCAKADAKALREALSTYGWHHHGCRLVYPGSYQGAEEKYCDCGWTAMRPPEEA